MTLTHHPLLHLQRDLQLQPRGMERFQRYLRTLSADGRTVDLPPLGLMNPIEIISPLRRRRSGPRR